MTGRGAAVLRCLLRFEEGILAISQPRNPNLLRQFAAFVSLADFTAYELQVWLYFALYASQCSVYECVNGLTIILRRVPLQKQQNHLVKYRQQRSTQQWHHEFSAHSGLHTKSVTYESHCTMPSRLTVLCPATLPTHWLTWLRCALRPSSPPELSENEYHEVADHLLHDLTERLEVGGHEWVACQLACPP
jgi:hypothetical protein